MRNINIGPRLTLGFGALALILLLQGLFGLNNMANMQEKADEVKSIWVPALSAVGELNLALMRYRVNAVRAVIDVDPAGIAQAESNLRARAQDVEVAQANFEKLITEPEERRIFSELREIKSRYIQGTEKVLTAMKQGDQPAALRIIETEQNPLADQMTQMLLELGKINRDGAAAAAEQSQKTYSSSKAWVIASIVLALIITAMLALVLSRSIVSPLQQAVKSTETIASGNLTQSIHVEGSDEPAQLLAALARMQDNLRSAISQIGNASVQLASAGEELSSVAEDSSRNLQRQNDEIQQAASAVTEMSAAVDEVARNAVSAVNGLLFRGRVPPGIDQEHVVGHRQVETDTTGFQRDQKGLYRFIFLEFGNLFLPLLQRGASVEVAMADAGFRKFLLDDLQHFRELREDEQLVNTRVLLHFAHQLFDLHRSF